MTKIGFSLVFLVILGIHLCESANILGVIACPFQSHVKPLGTYFKSLAQKGHNVTVLTSIEIEVVYQ